jgi:signal transduction histidine kinase
LRPRVLPRSALLLIGAVTAAGAAAAAARIPEALDWSRSNLVAFVGLAASIAVIEQFWIELRHETERENFSLTDAPFAASLLLVRPSVMTLAIAAGAVAGQAARRVAPLKLAFNVGQFLVGMAAAEGVYMAVDVHRTFGLAAWLTAVLAMAAYFLVNVGTVALVIALVEGEPFRKTLVSSLGLSILHWAGNVALGILGAVIWIEEPKALPLLVIPLGLSYLAYRGWILSLEERRRMAAMTRSAAAISAEGDLASRLPETESGDEVALLAATLNQMLDRIEAAFEQERRFISEASHELRTPITICRGHLEVLELQAGPEEVEETVAVLVDELARMGRILDDMATLARSEDPRFLLCEDIRLQPFLVDVVAKAGPLLDGRLRLAAVPGEAIVHADPQRLTQALVNLLQNAATHAGGEPPVELRVAHEQAAWRFEVADHGRGLRPGEEESVFRPFHRLDATAPGHGLGLAIVRRIAEAHGGSAGVDNYPGEGATFWIRVPA